MNTIKNIIKDIEEFSNQHQQINSFVYDDFRTYSSDITHPTIFAQVSDIYHQENGMSQVDINVVFVDILAHDEYNLLDVTSNLNILVQDFIRYFNQQIIADSSTQILNNKTDDNLLGLELSVSFDVNLLACYTPTNPEYIAPLKCSSLSIVPERPLEPYLFPITISTEGGIVPYSIDKKIEYITSQTEHGVGGYHGITGEINFIDEKTFDLVIPEETPYSNYPYFWFRISDLILGESVRITFQSKHISGGISRTRVSNKPWGPYDMQSFTPIDDGEWHDEIIEWDNIQNNGHIILFRHSTIPLQRVLRIRNLQIEYLDRTGTTEFNDEITLWRTFGDYTFNITSSDNQSCYTTESLVVPTPNDDLQLLVAEEDTYYGGMSTQVLIKGNSTGYVNWGDGVIDSYYATSDTYHMFIHNPTDRTLHFQNIDIYSDKLDGIGLVRDVYGSMMRIKKGWVSKVDASKLTLAMYKGDFLDNWDNYKDINGKSVYYMYSYYHTNNYMNINKMEGNFKTYFLQPYAVNNTSNQYTPRVYGDFGTFLKRYRGTDGILTNYTVMYGANVTYFDRLDEPFKPVTYVYCRGYSSPPQYWSIKTPNEVAQLIVDINHWATVKNGITIYITNNASPNNASEPLLTEFQNAKAEWITAGGIINHS